MMPLRLSQQRRSFLAAVTYERRLLALVGFLLFFILTDVFQVVMGGGFPAGRVKMLFYPPIALFVLLHLRYLLRALFAVPEIAALMLLVVVSVIWSVSPAYSAEQIFRFLVTTGAIMTIASMVSLRGYVLSMATFGGLVMVASLVAVALVPSARGIDPWPDTWRGLFSHKNGLGTFAAYAFLLAVAGAAASHGTMRRLMIGFAAISGIMLVASESRTAQIIALLSLCSLAIALAWPSFTRVWAAGYLVFMTFLAGFVTLAIVTGLADTFFHLIGRRPTLSGRIPLWELVWPWVTERIWTGYGYYSFWREGSRAVIEISRDRSVGFEPYYSHNGLIELLLHVGILGAILLALAIVRGLINSLAICRAREARPLAAASVTLLVAYLLFNITEGSFIGRESTGWMLLAGLITKLALAERALSTRSGSPLRLGGRLRLRQRSEPRRPEFT